MPSMNDSYTVSNAILLDVNLDDTGENHMWDFEDLESTAYDTINMVSVSETPFLYQFLFNNPLDEDYVADFGQQGDEIDMGETFTMEEVYFYYQNNDEDYRSLGMGATVNSIPLPMRSEPIDVIYQFPLTYGDSDTSVSQLALEIPKMLTYVSDQTRVNNVDGWGTISLPIGEFEVIRVRSELAITDSISFQGTGGQFDRPETIEYKWLAVGEGIPVLQINTVGGVATQVIYQDFQEGEPDNISDLNLVDIKVYPIPSENYVIISGLKGNERCSIRIRDLKGSLVLEDELDERSEHRVDISNLLRGTYILEIVSDNQVIQNKIVKE